jgi:hypothetical protein
MVFMQQWVTAHQAKTNGGSWLIPAQRPFGHRQPESIPNLSPSVLSSQLINLFLNQTYTNSDGSEKRIAITSTATTHTFVN